MDQMQSAEISIIGNCATKPPRKEGKNKDGQDQFLITFSLSQSAKGLWVEIFNRVWGVRAKQTPSLPLPIVSDNQIQICCPCDDRLQWHLDELKREIATANRIHREQLQASDDEKRAQSEILQKLRF
jgi:hypothetical protein